MESRRNSDTTQITKPKTQKQKNKQNSEIKRRIQLESVCLRMKDWVLLSAGPDLTEKPTKNSLNELEMWDFYLFSSQRGNIPLLSFGFIQTLFGPSLLKTDVETKTRVWGKTEQRDFHLNAQIQKSNEMFLRIHLHQTFRLLTLFHVLGSNNKLKVRIHQNWSCEAGLKCCVTSAAEKAAKNSEI